MKLDSLQFLRAFAAISVVIVHLWIAGTLSPYFKLGGIGGFGVDVFFVISGFIMCYTLSENSNVTSLGKAKDFITKRIIRIYPTYWILLIPAFFIFILNVYFKRIGFDFQSVIGSFLLIPDFSNNPKYHMILSVAWTLVYEMFFYFIFAMSICISKTKTQSILTFILVIVSLVSITNILGLQGSRNGWASFYYIVGDTLLLNFVFGAFCYFLLQNSENIRFPPMPSVIIAVALFILGIKLSHLGVSRVFAFGIPSFLIVLVFLVTSFDNLKSKELRLMILLGDASYSIYLIHPNLTFLADFANRLPSYLVDFYGFLLVCFTVIIGVIFHKKVELPLLANIKKWRKNYAI